jgi:hypothetical protein
MTTAPVAGSWSRLRRLARPNRPAPCMKVWFGKRRIEGAGLAGVRPHGLHPDTEDVALLVEEEGRLFVEAGTVRTVGADVEEVLGAGAPAPAGVQQHPGAARNAAMLRFPGQEPVARQQEIRVRRHLLFLPVVANLDGYCIRVGRTQVARPSAPEGRNAAGPQVLEIPNSSGSSLESSGLLFSESEHPSSPEQLLAHFRLGLLQEVRRFVWSQEPHPAPPERHGRLELSCRSAVRTVRGGWG